MNNNLIPEVRVDKNGVSVTKYVNPNGKGSPSSTRPIPAPSTPSAPSGGTAIIMPPPVNRKKADFLAIALELKDARGRPSIKSHLDRANETGLGILKRMLVRAPEHVDRIKAFTISTSQLLPSQDEMTNALLILEHLLTTKHTDLDLLSGEYSLEDFTSAVLGLRAPAVINGDEVEIIPTEEQLAADTSVAAFIGKNLLGLDDASESHPVFKYLTVERSANWSTMLPVLRNPRLEALLRERPDDHARIFEFMVKRNYRSLGDEPVDAILDYLNAANENPSLRDGWL